MDEPESLSHTKWECIYHVIFIPKCRRRTLYAELRKHLGEVFRRLASQKESRIEEGHLMCAHRVIATTNSDWLRPGVPIDRDHPFREIATSLWTGMVGAVG
jgi:Transposase IS200 like